MHREARPRPFQEVGQTLVHFDDKTGSGSANFPPPAERLYLFGASECCLYVRDDDLDYFRQRPGFTVFDDLRYPAESVPAQARRRARKRRIPDEDHAFAWHLRNHITPRWTLAELAEAFILEPVKQPVKTMAKRLADYGRRTKVIQLLPIGCARCSPEIAAQIRRDVEEEARTGRERSYLQSEYTSEEIPNVRPAQPLEKAANLPEVRLGSRPRRGAPTKPLVWVQSLEAWHLRNHVDPPWTVVAIARRHLGRADRGGANVITMRLSRVTDAEPLLTRREGCFWCHPRGLELVEHV